jgi:hypothetical protein
MSASAFGAKSRLTAVDEELCSWSDDKGVLFDSMAA